MGDIDCGNCDCDCGDCDCGDCDCDCGDCACGDCDCCNHCCQCDDGCSTFGSYMCGRLCSDVCQLLCLCCIDEADLVNKRNTTVATEPMLPPQQAMGTQPVIRSQSPIVTQPTINNQPIGHLQPTGLPPPSAPKDEMQTGRTDGTVADHLPPSYEEAMASAPSAPKV